LPKSDFHTHLKIVHNGKINIWETEPNFEPRYLQVPNKERPLSIWIYAKGEKKPAPDIHYLFNGEYRNSFVNQKRFDVMQFMRITFIKFSLPKVLAGLTSHLTITKNKSHAQCSYHTKLDGAVSKAFVQNFVHKNFTDSKEVNSILAKKNKQKLLSTIYIDQQLKRNLNKFSPIKDVKVDEGVSIKEDSLNYFIDYLGFEFLIDGNWLSWNMLSDGQYRKILNFLKEASEDKQIIITTHAPRTLDLLKDKELNRIILTRFDKELGTKMRHLTKEEIKEVIEYREDKGSTSELWSYTGFFDEEEVI